MPDGPFRDVVVIDLTRVLAGPFSTMLLGELGARVIKVENPAGGDDTRQFVPFWNGQSAYYLSLNRGKESIALNLKDPDDRQVFRGLIRRGDVLVENYRPGTLERLGFDWATLQQLNPRLIYASVSGFGQTGPWKHKPAYDMIIQALGGLMSLTGFPGWPPVKAGTSIADLAAGLFTVIGIASALYHRERTGRGLRVDVAMLDSLISLLEHAVMRYAVTGEAPGPIGNRHPSIAPFEVYDTADRPMVIAAGNDAIFHRLCEALGLERLAEDPRYRSNQLRVQYADDLKTDLEAVLRTNKADHWLAILDRAGVPASPVQSVAEAVEHPQVQARQMIVRAGELRMVGNPIKMDAFPDQPTRRPAPELGADGEGIRREFLTGEGCSSGPRRGDNVPAEED
ncbi:MAG: CoA transferase [Gemmataceae bacterium]|nr:CoA transferase [Gemmataceae bacterium]MDW8266823.1 CoA transferase [Gemmataceae bacterium]